MLSVASIQRRNAWRYCIRGVAFGDGRRPAGQSLKDAQELAGLPPGRWLGRGLRALGLTEGAECPSVSWSCCSARAGTRTPTASSATSRTTTSTRPRPRLTVLGQPIETDRVMAAECAGRRPPRALVWWGRVVGQEGSTVRVFGCRSGTVRGSQGSCSPLLSTSTSGKPVSSLRTCGTSVPGPCGARRIRASMNTTSPQRSLLSTAWADFVPYAVQGRPRHDRNGLPQRRCAQGASV